MASGGGERRVGGGPRIDHTRGPGRSRTGLVIDQLLSRGPALGSPDSAGADGRGGGPAWTSVAPVLRATSPSILEGHLTWLVSRAPSNDHHSRRRILTEDQTRILIRALDEGDKAAAIARALEQSWTADDVGDDDDDLITYAADLGTATAGLPDDSPYRALARSAAGVTAEILDHRGSAMRPRRRA